MLSDTRHRIAWSLTALMAVAGLWAWSQLPAGTQVPVHFNARGEPDGWGSAPLALLMLPLIALLTLLLQAALPHLEPRKDNLARSQPAVRTIFMAVVVLLAAAQAYLIAMALGWGQPQPAYFLLLLGLLLVGVGNVMGKLRPNYLVGIRTPWTLDTVEVWDQTHRFGGKLFVVAGLGLAVLAFMPIPSAWITPLILLLTLVPAAGAVLKSYLLWRRLQRSG